MRFWTRLKRNSVYEKTKMAANKTMKFTVVIPARFASTRLPGKPLADIAGKPMIQRTWEQACLSGAERVLVATDHEEVFERVKSFGGEVVMTSPDHLSGTDRLAEVADQISASDEDILVNVQGDEPLIPPQVIDQVANNLSGNRDCACATLAEPISTVGDFLSPAAVKVVFADNGKALYFSRAPIPYPRDNMAALLKQSPDSSLGDLVARRHIGIYAYKAGLLRQFTQWPAVAPELTESLEQLRILACGKSIHVDIARADVPGGVDTPEDLARVCRLFE